MDFIYSIEPQLVIPVLGVVACAVLVYIFGFQKTQEPSYQHLAVLQSSGKSNKNSQGKQKNATVNSSTANGKAGSKGKDKTLTNGHASPVQGKEKATKAEKAANKENAKPPTPATTPKASNKKEKKPVAPTVVKPAEDLDGGDWIQVKDKKVKSAPVKTKKDKNQKEDVSPPKEKHSPKSQRIEDVIFNMNKNNGKLDTLVVTNADSDAKILQETKTNVETPVQVEETKTPPTSVESTPKKSKDKKKKVAPAPVLPVKKVEELPKEPEKVEEKVPEPVPEPVVTPSKTKSKGPAAPESEFAKNVAFDELGGADAWEEAKSRGAKKKRPRKD